MTKMFILEDTELDTITQTKQVDVLHHLYELSENNEDKNFVELLNDTREWILGQTVDFSYDTKAEDTIEEAETVEESLPEDAPQDLVEDDLDQYVDTNEEDADEAVEEAETEVVPEDSGYDYEAAETTSIADVSFPEGATDIADSTVNPDEETLPEEAAEPVLVEDDLDQHEEEKDPTVEPVVRRPSLHEILRQANRIDKQ